MVRRASWLLGLFITLAGLFALALAAGPVAIAARDIFAALLGKGGAVESLIIVQLRLPRGVLAVLIGGALGLSGAALQGLLRNPLAAPDLFAAPQMAGFAAVLVLAFGGAGALSFYVPIAAVFGALLSVGVLIGVAGRRASLSVLILSGFGLSAAAAAATALVMTLSSNPFAILEIVFWLLGSLEDRSWRHVVMAAPFIVVGACLLFTTGARLRTLVLGDEAARSLGVDVAALRLTIIIATALCVGGAVAVAGNIGFVGLIAPHLMRPIFGHDPGRLLLPSALTGASLLLLADIIVRLIPAQSDVKVGIVTSLIGVPFLLAAVMRERRSLTGEAAL